MRQSQTSSTPVFRGFIRQSPPGLLILLGLTFYHTAPVRGLLHLRAAYTRVPESGSLLTHITCSLIVLLPFEIDISSAAIDLWTRSLLASDCPYQTPN